MEKVFYTTYGYDKTIFIGTRDHFYLAEKNGEYPKEVSSSEKRILIRDGWSVCKEQPLCPKIRGEIYLYMERNKFFDNGIEFEWEDEIKPKYNIDGFFYISGDNEVPVFAYECDWR